MPSATCTIEQVDQDVTTTVTLGAGWWIVRDEDGHHNAYVYGKLRALAVARALDKVEADLKYGK